MVFFVQLVLGIDFGCFDFAISIVRFDGKFPSLSSLFLKASAISVYSICSVKATREIRNTSLVDLRVLEKITSLPMRVMIL